jgi:hypothetical protein
LKKPLNFGAARISFDTAADDVGSDILSYYGSYNELLFAVVPTSQILSIDDSQAGLNTLAGHVLCGFPAQAAGLVSTWTEPEIIAPLGGDLLYPVQFMLFQDSTVRLIVYAEDQVILDTMVVTEKIIRLPTGFKSDLWQFELIGNTNVYSMQIAETAKGLAEV